MNHDQYSRQWMTVIAVFLDRNSYCIDRCSSKLIARILITDLEWMILPSFFNGLIPWCRACKQQTANAHLSMLNGVRSSCGLRWQVMWRHCQHHQLPQLHNRHTFSPFTYLLHTGICSFLLLFAQIATKLGRYARRICGKTSHPNSTATAHSDCVCFECTHSHSVVYECEHFACLCSVFDGFFCISCTYTTVYHIMHVHIIYGCTLYALLKFVTMVETVVMPTGADTRMQMLKPYWIRILLHKCFWFDVRSLMVVCVYLLIPSTFYKLGIGSWKEYSTLWMQWNKESSDVGTSIFSLHLHTPFGIEAIDILRGQQTQFEMV